MFLNVGYSFQSFTYDNPFEFAIDDTTTLSGQNQSVGVLKAFTGLTGVLTPKMTLLLSIGVNKTDLSTAAQNANAATLDEGITALAGNLQLNWQNTSTSKTFLQFSRNVSQASLFKYVDVIGSAIGGELRSLGTSLFQRRQHFRTSITERQLCKASIIALTSK